MNAQPLKKSTAAFVVASCVAIFAVHPASAITVTEYDSKTVEQRGQIVEDAVMQIINHFSSRKPDQAKVGCINRLFMPATKGGISRGVELLVAELQKVRAENLASARFEAVLLGVVNRECPNSN